MTLSSVSTFTLGTSLLEPVQKIQTALSQDGVEATTGQYADLGLQLGEQAGFELSLRNQSDALQAMTSANSVISTNLTTTQDALNSIAQGAQTTLQNLASWTSNQTSGVSLQSQGVNGLQQLVPLVNTTSNGQYVFAGQNVAVPPMSDYLSSSPGMAAIDQAFQTTFGISLNSSGVSTISPSDLQNFLTGAFANLFQGASWSQNWSSASSANSTAQVAPGQTVETTTSANQPGVQEVTEAYAMLAAFGGASLSTAAQQTVVTAASSLLGQGLNDITSMQASIGTTQAQITDANAMMASQLTLMQTQIGDLDNVDSAQVATNLSALSTQLQTAYQLTAQLQKLSLAQYLLP
ncbi:MAG TPA: flagellar hook-associated family protein [Methylocella sp.]|nr:flagellar hook-associated family protein [Methylocella sp.]